MSAIAGVYSFERSLDVEESLQLLVESLHKYPADDIRTWQSDQVGFGCLAQWVTPESIGEVLPRYDAERRLAITADAIIDNRKELFDLLNVEATRRKAITDSELILLAYRKWGEDAPCHLIGDFAFMIWDEHEQTLFGAADCTGRRTLYYYKDLEQFSFCTVMDPLLALPGVSNELNEEWLAQFIVIPGMVPSVNTHQTVYRQIQQLPQAHTIRIQDQQLSVRQYTTLIPEEELRLKDDAEYLEAFRDVFGTAVRDRLRSVKPVGTHLSGGLDSGAVAAFAAPALGVENKQLSALCYVPYRDFVDWTPPRMIANEQSHAQATVDYVGNIDPYYLAFEKDDPLTVADEWLEILEMPYKFFENSYWVQGFYKKAAEMGLGVLLSGFRGNYTVSWNASLDYYDMLVRQGRWVQLYKEMGQLSQKSGRSKVNILRLILNEMWSRRKHTKMESDNPWIHPDLANRTEVYEKLYPYGLDSTEHHISAAAFRNQQFEYSHYNNSVGTIATKLSLKYGVMERDPTSDARLIRFCLSLPLNQYTNQGMDRALIRRAGKGIMPDEIRLNMSKRGVQAADWLDRIIPVWNEVKEEINTLVNDPLAQHYLHTPQIKQTLAEIGDYPRAEQTFDVSMRHLMRAVILYRFLVKIEKGGGRNEKRMEKTSVGAVTN